MKKQECYAIISLLVLLFQFESGFSQNVSLEYFPGELQSILQDAPTSSAMKVLVKDSLESDTYGDLVTGFYTHRIRGYLVPSVDGYFKFFLQSVAGSFYLSSDSMEYHKRLAIATYSWPWSPPWPSNLGERYNSSTTYYVDSTYLKKGKPYYFEVLQTGGQWLIYNYFGLRWVLPGGDKLQTIKNNEIKPAAAKPIRSEVDYDIFGNQSESDFTTLKSKPFPNQRLNLHSLSADNIPQGLDNFSSRIRGYIIPPYSGNYSFYLASDDASQFWFSSDSLETNIQLKGSIITSQTDWKQNVSSQELMAGQKYFFEILHHDSTGNSMVKLGWAIKGDTIPEIIGYSNLMGYSENVVPDKIRLNEHKKYLQREQSFTLLAEVYPWNTINKKVRWRSSNPSVATVNSNGLVNTLQLGGCQIIVQCDADTTVADTLSLNVNRIDWELFKNRTTYNFDSLRNSSELPDQVVEIVELNTTNYLSTLDNYSSRIRGYLLPPVTGEYSFYFACDDAGQFWLSPDSIQSNALLKSEIDTVTNDWSKHISVQTLTAGHKYFFELLHHDSVYIDKIKLGWIVPGDTIPVVIRTPFIAGSEDNASVNTFSLVDKKIMAYPNFTLSPRYNLTPWNATDKLILWESSNIAVASVSANGLITTIGPGVCNIYAHVSNTALVDTLRLTVTDYYGPFFVKQNADVNGDGHTWDNPIPLIKLLDRLNQGPLAQRVNVYIAQGTYKPTDNLDRTKSFIVDNLRIVGGFSQANIGTDTLSRDIVNHETILSGEIGIPGETGDNSYHVVITRGTSVIDGFTIRDGRANSKSFGDDNWPNFPENRGGGILAQAVKTIIYNSKIYNNSAWDVAGGISLDCGQLIMQHCQVTGNLIQQTVLGGTMFSVYSNGYGGGMRLMGTSNIKDCIFQDNRSLGAAPGAALASVDFGTVTTIENCTFDKNFSNANLDLFNYQGSTINLINSTLMGSFTGWGWTNTNVINSTIVGGGYIAFEDNHISFDNSIWTKPNLNFYPSTTQNTWQAKYSILGDSLFGANKENLISENIQDYGVWLDTLANNGGPTPTMRLKNISGNPARSKGNPLYLGAADQRGAIRTDSVSIGAYQWVKATNITIAQHQVSLCPGDSLAFSVSYLPLMVSDSSCSVYSSDISIARVAGSKIYALAPGKVNVIVRLEDGGLSDTCKVEVFGAIGTGTISGASKIFPGQKSVNYTVTPIDNATSYIWTLPEGATGTSTSNTILIDFGESVGSGVIKVRGENDCGEGEEIVFNFSFYGSEPKIYVSPNGAGLKDGSDWSNALDGNTTAGNGYTRLSDLMKWSKSGAQFWIGEGTYKACTDNEREKYFSIAENIQIFGGFFGNEISTDQRDLKQHKSIFSGNIGLEDLDTDNSFHVFATIGSTWTNFSTLDGICVEKGYAGNYTDSNSGSYGKNNGGGIYNTHLLVLSNIDFSNCLAAQNGGAVFNSGIIQANNCLFDHNSAGSGGGVHVAYTTNPAVIQAKLSHCNFSNNTSWYSGGAISNGGVAEIRNSLIVNNASGNGGGIYCGGNANYNFIHTDIYNTTIANNSSDALFNWGSAKIYNSIIWGSEIATWNNTTLDIRNSCVKGNIPGIGIISEDPKFICPTRGAGTDFDGLNANWALLGNSPVIDKGDDNLIPADLVSDLAGTPRIHSSSVDLGAYERQTPTVLNEGCLNLQGVNIEYFTNPLPNVQDAPTSSASQIVPINSLGSQTLINNGNAFRIRGYLLPPKTGYYKFYLSSFSWSTFYLSLDSMEYHKKLAITSCCNFPSPWPASYSDRNEQNTTYHMDSLFLKQDAPYYFEIMESCNSGSYGKTGIRWTLPGSNQFQPIEINNLKQAGPKFARSDVEWELFKNQNSYNFETLGNTDSVPGQKIILKALITENFSDGLDHYNSRIRGYIVPTVSGNYLFYFAANDAGQFWLSSDTSKVNARLKSNFTSTQSDWKQNSSSQTLVAEEKYYFEILHHDNLGDDQVKLGWAVQGDTIPEIITNTFLIGYLDGILPTKVSFEEKIIYVRKNQPITPAYQVYPWNAENKKLIWKSSEESVATVDGTGLITPVKAGLCKIIIQSDADPSLTDTLRIAVTRVELELFKNSYAANFGELKESAKTPDEIIDIEALERSNGFPVDYFSSRVRGYLIPPVSGDYTFYFAADDAGQFWLSTDSTATHAILKNDIPSIQADWMLSTSAQELIAGKKYYFELLHYENNYTDLFKLGWKIPGKDVPEVIQTPYMTGWIPQIAVESISFLEHENVSFLNSSFTPRYSLQPWNTNNTIQWSSTNANIASVNSDGAVTTLNPGVCQIIALMADNKSVGDTLKITVTDYYGPYFVKENAAADDTGQSWDNAIGLTKLLDWLNQAEHQQKITVFVAQGTYKPTTTTDRTKTFLLNNIRMVGGFAATISGSDTTSRDFLAHETILSGEIGLPDETIDNSYHVVVTQGRAEIDGVTIRDGRASCSTYGSTPGVIYNKRDDAGGGIRTEGISVLVKNCRIINNSAWAGGGGMSCHSSVTIQNCMIADNKTQSAVINTGGWFLLTVNSVGAAISAATCHINIISSIVYNNISQGTGAVFLEGATVNIEGSSFYNNSDPGSNNSLYARDGSGIVMNNSTVQGDIYGFYSPLITISNSTISGKFGASYVLKKNGISFDNSIVNNFDLSAFPDTSILAKHSILGNQLFGANKESIISTTIPDSKIWLDSLANNGGLTPTMKLKSMINNPAKSKGNPLYLGTADQRGAIRTDSVSIGAYQWVKATNITISQHQVSLCPGDSIAFNIIHLPVSISDSSFTVTSTDITIARVAGSKIFALSPGKANIVVRFADGGLTDTCKVEVRGAIGTGTISGASMVFPGQKSVNYTVTPIDNATSYIWTLPAGATGSGTSNTISIDFGETTGSGEIKVRGENDCGEGEDIVFNFQFYGLEPRIYVTPEGAGLKDGSDWSNALDGNTPAGNGYTRLSNLMKWSKSGTQFWISEGTYKACTDNDREKTFETISGIEIYGGFEGFETEIGLRNQQLHQTIFSGNIGDSLKDTDNSFHVLVVNSDNNSDSNSGIIDGVTIGNGYSDLPILSFQPGFLDPNLVYNKRSLFDGLNYEGSGILVRQNAYLILNNVQVLHNKSYGNGTGINIKSGARVTIDHSKIENNEMLWDYIWFFNYYYSSSGTGIYNNGNLEILNSHIDNNVNGYGGAGIYNSDTLIISNCKIEDNKGIDPINTSGVGIYNSGLCSVEGTDFSGNKSNKSGGAIYNSGKIKITDSNLQSNNASEGGGIYNAENGLCDICNLKITKNTSDGNAAGCFNKGTLNINRCLVSNNKSGGSVGALYNPSQVSNTIIVNNECANPRYGYEIPSYSGGISIDVNNSRIINCTVMNNNLNGIISTSQDSALVINSIIYNNEYQVSGNIKVVNSCVEGISNSILSVKGDDPVIKNPSAGRGVGFDGTAAEWSLSSCSWCVNMGNNQYLSFVDSLDAIGNTRLEFNTVDLGAIESNEAPNEVIDYSTGTVFVSDSGTLNGLGTTWQEALAGNAPSCRYPGHSLLYQVLREVPQNCKIWVKGGTYPVSLDGDRSKSFEIRSYTKLFGGFAGNETSINQRVVGNNETILSGNIGNSKDSLDNAYHVMVTAQSLTLQKDTTLVDQVNILYGQADGTMGGGLIINKNNKIRLVSCKINSNSSGGCYNQGVAIMENCEISGNAAYNMGAGIYNDNFIELKRSRIINNQLAFPEGNGYQEWWGGAGIYNSTGCTVNIDSSEISHNYIVSSLLGAGIMNCGNLSITHSKIENNNTPRYGGGIYSTGKIYLADCQINKNYSSNGAIANYSDGEIFRCSFENNEAGISRIGFSQKGCPAGIANSGNLKIKLSLFKNNRSVGPGGAIQNSGFLSVDSTNFEGNWDSFIIPDSDGGMLTVWFISPSWTGGAICNTSGEIVISNSLFRWNKACYGGAITTLAGKVSLSNCILVQNQSIAGGAALLNHGSTDFTNCLITNNYCYGKSGIGGIVTTGKGSNTIFTNCNLVNNGYDGGIIVTGTDESNINKWDPTLTKDTVTFENSIIRGSGSTITNPNSSLITMNYSNSDVSIPGVGNINSDPLFVNPTAGNDTTYNALLADWTLSACSPAINAGNDSIASDSLDLAGNARKYNRVDMGVYEMKFDNSIMDLHDVNTRNNGTTIQWTRSVNPCSTIVFMKDTVAGAPVPVPGTSYSPDSLYSGGGLLDGWHCIYKGSRSEVSVTGLTNATTYRVAAFNYYPDNFYGTPEVKNFKTLSPSVSISPNELILCPNGSATFKVTVVPKAENDTLYSVVSSDESIASVSGNTIVANSTGKVNIILRSRDGTLTDTCKVEVRAAIANGTISGPTIICQGQNKITYSVSEIQNATAYVWTLPTEVSGTSDTNAITVDFGGAAMSGNISVKGQNECGDGEISSLAITLNSRPASPVPGTVTQPDCQSATGTVDLTGLPETGEWNLTATPGGAAISGSGVLGNFTNLAPDTYSFTVTDLAGCTSAPSSQVVINPQPPPSVNKQLIVHVFLEGAFNAVTGLMHTTLLDNLMIPKYQPYNVAPWNYNGSEHVTNIPSDVVDWVLVELRHAASAAEALPDSVLPGWPRACFLKSDGSVADLDGTTLPTIGNPSIDGNLYVIIRHRNHIAIISAFGMTANCDDYTYNFTDAMTKAHGNSAGFRQIIPGTFGMVSGDSDGDSSVSVLDFSKWATDFGKTLIYLQSDIDMDGEVSVLDFSKWATNFGMENIAPLKDLNLQGIEGHSPVRYRSQVPGN